MPPPKLVKITRPGSRLILRSPRASDAASMLSRIQDPLCTAHLPHLASPPTPFTISGITQQIGRWRASSGISDLFLVVCLLPSATSPHDEASVIGDGGFEAISAAAEGTAHCGIMLDSSPEVRGKGYAVESLKMMAAFAFEHLDVGRVVFGTAADNLPMKGLLERHLELTACWREKMQDWEFVLTRDVWETWAESGLVVEELDPSC